MSEVDVTWYANDQRATITDEQGVKWWLAPSPNGGYYALCDDTGDTHQAGTLGAVLEALLGDVWRQYLTAGAA